jgi:hypothetical protein
MKTGSNKLGRSNSAITRTLRSAPRSPRDAAGDVLLAKRRALEAHYLATGAPGVLDHLHEQLTVKEAASFLGTTVGQLYNLIEGYEIPFILWGKAGKRLCRLDLLVWRDLDANERADLKGWLMHKYPRK